MLIAWQGLPSFVFLHGKKLALPGFIPEGCSSSCTISRIAPVPASYPTKMDIPEKSLKRQLLLRKTLKPLNDKGLRRLPE